MELIPIDDDVTNPLYDFGTYRVGRNAIEVNASRVDVIDVIGGLGLHGVIDAAAVSALRTELDAYSYRCSGTLKEDVVFLDDRVTTTDNLNPNSGPDEIIIYGRAAAPIDFHTDVHAEDAALPDCGAKRPTTENADSRQSGTIKGNVLKKTLIRGRLASTKSEP